MKHALSRPVVRITAAITLIGIAAIAWADAAGTSAANDVFGAIFAYSSGVQISLVLCLGIWAGLRDCAWKDRVAVPLTLACVAMIAEMAGQRLNHSPRINLGNSLAFATYFLTSFALAICFRILVGWRIGPTSEFKSSRFRLSGMFVWIGVVALLLASATSIGRGADFELYAGQVPQVLLLSLVLSLLASTVVIPSIGTVMAQHRLRYFFFLTVILIAFAALAMLGAVIGEGIPVPLCFVPHVIAFTTVWVFLAYRSAGYHFVGQERCVGGIAIFGVGALLLVVATVASGIELADFRKEARVRENWGKFGVYPVQFEGDELIFVTFGDHTFPITREAIDALKKQTSLTGLEVRSSSVTPEQIGWISELESVETLSLGGTGITDQHLEELHNAKHLKTISLNWPAVTPAGVQKLQKNMSPGGSVTGPAPLVMKRRQTVPATVVEVRE